MSKLAVVVHSYNHSTYGVEVGGSRVHGHSGLYETVFQNNNHNTQ